jgi:hypothetical protein
MTETLRTDLNDFLFTTVADDADGMHLTMLSVLARTGVDPWMEAAGLAALSRDNATQKLVLMLAGVPNGPSPGADTANLAARLVEHLHASPKSRIAPPPSPLAHVPGKMAPLLSFAALPARVRLAIYSVVTVIFMAMCYHALASPEAAVPTEAGQEQSR